MRDLGPDAAAKADYIPCKVCGALAKYTLAFHSSDEPTGPLSFYLCPKCGLLFAEEVPDTLIARAYQAIDVDCYYETTEKQARAKAIRSARDIGRLLQDSSLPHTVLDVGCGFGHFRNISVFTRMHV